MALNLTVIASDKALKQSLFQGLDALEQQNYDQAAKWFIEAASQGDAEAQFQLALLILSEQNLTINYPVQARELMNQSADQGHLGALTWLQNASPTTAVNLSINTAVNLDTGFGSDAAVNPDAGSGSDAAVNPDAGSGSDAAVNLDVEVNSATEVDLDTEDEEEANPEDDC
jgi:TPR repeat protein